MQLKETCGIFLTFLLLFVCQVSSKDIFSTNRDDDNAAIDLITDDRSKRTNYRSINDIQGQSSLLSLPYKASGSYYPRQLRQSPYFALRGKRIPAEDYSNTDDNDLFNEENVRNIPSSSLQSRGKLMHSLLNLLDSRYDSLIRRVIGQNIRSQDKTKDVMNKRQHYRFHALRG